MGGGGGVGKSPAECSDDWRSSLTCQRKGQEGPESAPLVLLEEEREGGPGDEVVVVVLQNVVKEDLRLPKESREGWWGWDHTVSCCGTCCRS